MMRLFSLCFSLCITWQVIGQEPLKKYFVAFTDKPITASAYLQPQSFLSRAAIDRRHQARISMDESDLPLNPSYVKQVVARCSIYLVSTKWLNGVGIIATDSQIKEISALPFVRNVQYLGPHYGFRFQSDATPLPRILPDSSLRAEPPFDQFVTGYARVMGKLSAPASDLFFEHGRGITVAVMDGGFSQVDASPLFAHMDARGGIVSTRDFVEGDRGVYEASNHGSSVFSLMAANIPQYYVAPAPDADYHLLITEATSGEFPIEELNWIAGAEYADSIGAQIINASLGYTSFNDTTLSHTYRDLDGRTTLASRGAEIAARKGMLIFNSAGNSGDEPWKYLGAPADARGLIAVGALDKKGKRASFSSFGPTSDGRIKPDLSVHGHEVAAMAQNGRDITVGSGTSYASPLLAANVAALWSNFPHKSGSEIMEAVYFCADKRNKPDTITGYGNPDFECALLQLLGNESVLLTEPIRPQPTPGGQVLVVDGLVDPSMSDSAANPVAVQMTDLLGKRTLTLKDDGKNLQILKRGRLYFLKWTGSQATKGLVRCKIIFAEGYILNTFMFQE